MKNRGRITRCIVASMLIGGMAEAALLVDTGPGGTSSIGAPSLFLGGGHFQDLAGKFTLASPATLDSVEGWMVGGTGNLAVVIRADGAVPGDPIFSRVYAVDDRFSAGWEVFPDYYVSLPAGTYWLSFEPSVGSGLQRSMPLGATAPLASYAYLGDGNPGWIELSPNPGLGMRVSGGPLVTAPFGTASRTIVDAPSKDSDMTLGGDSDVETFGWDFTAGDGWAIGRGTIFANGLQAGAEAVNSQAYNAARAVAWRSFQNTGASTVSLRVNATLLGEFAAFGGTVSLKAWSGIYALDAASFSSTIAASGKTAPEFLLGGNALSGTVGAQDRPSLAVLFPPAARLGSDTELVPFSSGSVSVPMQTGLFSLAPGQVFTLLFDVTALASGTGGGKTSFIDTLKPAAVLFTDAGGGPVPGIQALGATLSVGEASFLLWDDRETLSWQAALGATQSRLVRGTEAGLPGLLNAAIDSCQRYQGSATSSGPILSEEPPPGTLYWYLAVGVNGAIVGGAGDATLVGRVVNSSGPCF